MYPTRVPTYSTEIGTSRSTTGSTFTTAAGGDAVARDASPHPAAVITTSPISETTSSPRMSIMRRLLSSGAEGKRIHSQADLGAASLADPFPVEHRGEPERGRACPRSAAPARPIRMQRSPHPRPCPRRLLVPCDQRHAEDTPQGEPDGGRTRSAH